MSYIPFVSVVIPTYNRAPQVRRAVESVLGQTYLNYEVIVVDDGSTDGTAEAVRSLIGQRSGDSRQIRYFLKENQGSSSARNRGIKEANGEWIAFLDSDDVWLPEKLEWQVRAVMQFKANCVACSTDSQTVNLQGGDAFGFLSAGRHYDQEIGLDVDAVRNVARSFSNYWISALFARADSVKQITGFDPQIQFCEDRDFSFRLFLLAPVCYVNKSLVKIDRTPSPTGSIIRPWDKYEARLQAEQSMFEKWLRLDPKLPPDVQKTVIQNLRAVHSGWTNWYLETQQYAQARRAASRAVKYEFTPKLAIKWALTQFAPGLARRISPKTKPYL